MNSRLLKFQVSYLVCLKIKHNGELKVKFCTNIFHLHNTFTSIISFDPLSSVKKDIVIVPCSEIQKQRPRKVKWLVKVRASQRCWRGLNPDLCLFHYITRKVTALLLFFVCNYRINPGKYRTFKNQLTLQEVETHISLLLLFVFTPGQTTYIF